MTTPELERVREQIITRGMAEADLDADPIEQFHQWSAVAEEAGVYEPQAMTLATVDADGCPDARMVLLRRVDADGFHWYTDRSSDKGRQLTHTPRAALVIAWPVLGRQVRVVGPVRESTSAESDDYWATRPRGSQLAAVTSQQSRPLADRAELEHALAAAEEMFEGRDVPRPARWGGYVLIPERIEFWQQRPFRMHDRLRYQHPSGEGVGAAAAAGWEIVRLAP